MTESSGVAEINPTGGGIPQAVPAAPAVKPRWISFLETAGGTALITVILGGLLTNTATWLIQRGAAKREFAQTWLKARGDQALQGHTAYLQEQRQMLESAYSLVGKMAAASDNLIAITAPSWDYPTSGDKQDMIRYRKEFNSAEDDWRRDEEKLSFELSYYSDGNPDVGKSWEQVRRTVDAYRECASSWHDGAGPLRTQRLRLKRRHLPPSKTWPWFEEDAICSVQREALTQKMAQLGRALEATRTYVWRGWQDPDQLRQVLVEK